MLTSYKSNNSSLEFNKMQQQQQQQQQQQKQSKSSANVSRIY